MDLTVGLLVTVACDVPGCEIQATTKSLENHWDFGSFGDGRSGWIDDTWTLPDGWTRVPEFGGAQHDDEGFRCPAHRGAPIGVKGVPLPPWVTETTTPSEHMREWLKGLPTALLFDPVTPAVLQQLTEQGAKLDARTAGSLEGRVKQQHRLCQDLGEDYDDHALGFLTEVLGPKLAERVMDGLASRGSAGA